MCLYSLLLLCHLSVQFSKSDLFCYFYILSSFSLILCAHYLLIGVFPMLNQLFLLFWLLLPSVICQGILLLIMLLFIRISNEWSHCDWHLWLWSSLSLFLLCEFIHSCFLVLVVVSVVATFVVVSGGYEFGVAGVVVSHGCFLFNFLFVDTFWVFTSNHYHSTFVAY